VSDASRVFIYTPIGINTGGPEALYQLADGLKNLGIQTFLVPTMETVHNSTCEVFSQYEAHIYTGNTFKPNDILIVPESVERLPNRLVNSFRNNLVIYWLSVDYAVYKGLRDFEANNYCYHTSWSSSRSAPNQLRAVQSSVREISSHLRLSLKVVALLRRFAELYGRVSSKQLSDYRDYIHIAQSKYAQDLVSKEFGVECFLLNEYVTKRVVGNKRNPLSLTNQRKLVAYNPRKGLDLLQKLMMQLGEDIEFVPISGLNKSQVQETLMHADLYIDFGHFPGRDRIPRESLLCGTPILIAMRGAARNEEDFKIMSFYKIDLHQMSVSEACERIQKVLGVPKHVTFRQQIDFYKNLIEEEVKYHSQLLSLVKFLNVNLGTSLSSTGKLEFES
jgi:hypothetical protein